MLFGMDEPEILTDTEETEFPVPRKFYEPLGSVWPWCLFALAQTGGLLKEDGRWHCEYQYRQMVPA